jgi:hypothetical protein
VEESNQNLDEVECPYCAEEKKAKAKKCKHCREMIVLQIQREKPKNISKATPVADYGLFLLAIPIAAIFLIWFWVGQMTLFQSPSSTLTFITIATILSTALIASMEINKNQTLKELQETRKKESPIASFFAIVVCWVICYPAYLYKRKNFGLKNYVVVGVIIVAAFVASTWIMTSFINDIPPSNILGYR